MTTKFFQSRHFACLQITSRTELRPSTYGTRSFGFGLRLRSFENIDLRLRRMKNRFSDRAFWAAGPRCWNGLPSAIQAVDSGDSFKSRLETHLFSKAYTASYQLI